jgi:hypothetical protein
VCTDGLTTNGVLFLLSIFYSKHTQRIQGKHFFFLFLCSLFWLIMKWGNIASVIANVFIHIHPSLFAQNLSVSFTFVLVVLHIRVTCCGLTHFIDSSYAVYQQYSTFLCSRTSWCNFSSTLYPQNCWCIIKVIHSLQSIYKINYIQKNVLNNIIWKVMKEQMCFSKTKIIWLNILWIINAVLTC